MSILSSSEFMKDNFSGQATPDAPEVESPLSLSSSTVGSANQATAWRNRSLGHGKPMALSSKTSGSTYKWEDSSQTNLPESDKGASFGKA